MPTATCPRCDEPWAVINRSPVVGCRLGERPGVGSRDVDAGEIRTAAEVELLSPDERQQLFNDHVISGFDDVPAEFRERIRARGQQLLRDRGLIDNSPT